MTDKSDGEDADLRIEWSDIDRSNQRNDKGSEIDETVADYRRGYAQFGEFDTAVCSAVEVSDGENREDKRVAFTWEGPAGEETDVKFHLPEEVDDLNKYLSEHEVTEPSDMIGAEHPCVRGENSWHLWDDTTVNQWWWLPITKNRLMWSPGGVLALLAVLTCIPVSLWMEWGIIWYIGLTILISVYFFLSYTVKLEE